MITVSYNAYCAISKEGDNDIWTVRPRGVVPLLPMCSQIDVGATDSTVNALLGDTFSRENNTRRSRFHERDPQFASRILGAMTQSCYIGTHDIWSRVIRSPYCNMFYHSNFSAITWYFLFIPDHVMIEHDLTSSEFRQIWKFQIYATSLNCTHLGWLTNPNSHLSSHAQTSWAKLTPPFSRVEVLTDYRWMASVASRLKNVRRSITRHGNVSSTRM